MIKGVAIKCTDDEMKNILEFLVIKNNYQLPKEVVFIIKEDKPKFSFFKRKKTDDISVIEEKSSLEEIIIPNNNENFSTNDNNIKAQIISDDLALKREEIDNLVNDILDNTYSNGKESEDDKDLEEKLLYKIELVENTLKSLEETRLSMENTINNLQTENTKLIKNRNGLLIFLENNLNKFKQEDQELIKMYLES